MLHYCILAHKAPAQIEKLINKLNSPQARFYIHLDANQDISEFSYINAYFIKNRVKVYRGGFSMIKATINSYTEIFPYMKPGDHLILISGQCFPIKPPKKLESFFSSYPDKSFVEYYLLKQNSNDKCQQEKWESITKYHFLDIRIPNFIDNLLYKLLNFFVKLPAYKTQVFSLSLGKIFNIFLPKKRKLLTKYRIYRGSQWHALCYAHVKYLLDFINTKEGIYFSKLFKTMRVPDEVFIQTLFLNSHHYKEIENELLRYIDWETGPDFPRTLNENDYNKLIESNKLFARKFELKKSDALLKKFS